MPGARVNVITPEGDPVSIPEEALAGALEAGYALEGTAGELDRATREGRIEGLGVDTVLGKVRGAASELLGGASLGLTTALEATNPADAEAQRLFREENPGLATGAGIVGALATAVPSGGAGLGGALARATPSGAAAALGARLARSAEGAGVAAKIGRGVLGGAAEGALAGAGTAAADLALSEDPLTLDRIASAVSSRFLYGGAVGGAAGGALRGLEVTLGAAGRRLARAQDEAAKVGGVPDDLAALDRKGLRQVEADELARIEADRVPGRAQLATDVASFREATKRDQPWVALASGARRKGVPAAAGEAKYPRWVREAEKVYLESDKLLDRVLRNPKRLAEAPQVAKAALQQQEAALETIVQRADELRTLHLGDTTGRRAAALERVPATLEANRALQQRLADLTAAPASPRLTAITDAVDQLGARSQKTLGEQMAGGAAYGLAGDAVRAVAGLVPGGAFLGSLAAPLLGARAADAIAGRLAGQLSTVTREATARTAQAVDAFLTTTRKAERIAPIVASRVLTETRFAPAPTRSRAEPPVGRKPAALEAAYEERAAELASAVAPGPDGRPVVRPGARAQIAERLRPIAAVAPHVADRLETHAVKRLEFLAARLPTVTRLGMTRIPPSEMAMRAFARYVAAVDDPGAIEERLASGTVTPEDAEVMRELYPDRMAEITRQIVERLPTLRATLPYHRRLALSIFTGAPVDAAMDPRILSVLQAQYAEEEHSEGGTQAPRPQPAFGSVRKSVPTPTPAQARAEGAIR